MSGAVTRRKTVLGWALGALTLSSLSVTFAETEKLRLMPFSAVWALSLVGLWFLYRTFLQMKNPFAGSLMWLLAALFAGVMTLANSYAHAGTMELFTGSPAAMLKSALHFAGRLPLYFAALRLLQGALVNGGGGEQDLSLRKCKGIFALFRGSVPVVAILLLICWLPYFFCTFPGVVSNDSITQLMEIYGVKALSNGNPIFQTFLIGLCVHIGEFLGGADASVALYCTAQGVLMALLLAYTLQTIREAKAPQWLIRLSFLFYALCPIFPLFAFCVGKDTNFAMAVLYFSLMVWRVLLLREGEKPSVRVIIGLCISTALVALLRNPGVYLAALTLAGLCLWTLRKTGQPKKRKLWLAPTCALGTLLCCWVTVHIVLLPLLGAQPMPETEEYSLPLQQVARVVATEPETLTAQEHDAIAAVLDFDRVKEAYNGELSDPIKLLWNESASAEEKSAFFSTWLSLLPKHPATYFSATFHNTYGYLCPGYMSTIKPTLLIGKQGHTTELSGLFDFSVNPQSDALKATMDTLSGQPLFRVLISPGIYGWITLFAVITLLSSRRRSLLLASIPALFTLAGCLLSAVNGYFRYALPLYFCAPLLLALCVQALHPTTHEGEKKNESAHCTPLL